MGTTAAVVGTAVSVAGTVSGMVSGGSKGSSSTDSSYQIEDTESENALKEIAVSRWNTYKSEYIPFENKWLADISGYTGPEEDRIAGQINADAMQKYGGKLLPEGGDPSSGAFQNNQSTLDFGQALGRATVGGREGVVDTQAKLLQKAVDMGTDQADDVEVGYNTLAKDELQTAMQDAYLDYRDDSSTLSSLGSLAGLATSKYSSKIGDSLKGLFGSDTSSDKGKSSSKSGVLDTDSYDFSNAWQR